MNTAVTHRMNSLASLFLALFAMTCSGCDKHSEAKTDAPGPTPTASTTVASVAHGSASGASADRVPWAAIPGATANLLPNMSIPERFQIEASSRPQGLTPNADDVFKAFASRQLTVTDTKQHLGSPFGARYCLGGRATSDPSTTLLHISVCEYISPELAKAASEYSAQTMSSIENRTVRAHKQLSLTIREEKKAPENDAAAAKATEIFEKL
jgi:hypothetical protein